MLSYICCIKLVEKKLPSSSKNILKLLLISNSGLLVAAIILFLYLFGINSVSEGIDFIFRIPTSVIMPYRKLPLPGLNSFFSEDSIFYVSLLSILLTFITTAKLIASYKADKKIILLLLMLMPFSTFHYALGRSDHWHFIPFLFLTLGSITLFYSITGLKRLVFIAVITIYFTFPHVFSEMSDVLDSKVDIRDDISKNLDNCKQAIQGKENYQSMFVGRENYDRFIFNNAALYLINPKVKPASSFISDEPGLQNSCHYGQVISQQLKNSKKPMLVFLEKGLHNPEPNKTQEMHSCGKIEKFLATAEYEKIGNCNAYNQDYEIRIYH
jgi:hypothetical protein